MKIHRLFSILIVAAMLALLSACSTKPTREPPPGPVLDDRAPNAADIPDLDAIPEPIPRAEPPSRFGNPATYEVFGRTYRTMDSAVGYRSQGVASWYGAKFHGRRTSSGEPYDMFAMTAAHPSLPLPTYVRVTNLENGKSVVVRVNDRGPFLRGRVIDLSYAAAHRIGMLGKGTAQVEIVALEPWDGRRASQVSATPAPANTSPRPQPVAMNASAGAMADSGRVYLQLGAFSEVENAERLGERLRQAGLGPVQVSRMQADTRGAGLFRVRLGPASDDLHARELARSVEAMGFGMPAIIVD